MLLLDMITHISIKYTNKKEYTDVRAKTLFINSNTVKDKPTQKDTRKKSD